MAEIETPFWKNKDPNNKDLEELAITIQQIIEYLNTLDARLTAGGL